MELQDLQEKWADYDKRLTASLQLNTRLWRESGLNRMDSALERLSRVLLYELLVNLVAVVLLGSFLADHVREVRFLAPAVLLDLFALFLVRSSIYQWVVRASIDYSAPIVEIQKKLQLLRIDRIRTTKWALLLGPLLWTPLLIVAFKGLLGVDAYTFLDRGWLAANLLFGVGVVPLLLWVSKRYGDRFRRSPFVLRLLDDIAGRSLHAATGFLGELARFEEEEEPFLL